MAVCEATYPDVPVDENTVQYPVSQMTYRYTDIAKAPAGHFDMLMLLASGMSVPEVAERMGVQTAVVYKVRRHAPNVAFLREHQECLMKNVRDGLSRLREAQSDVADALLEIISDRELKAAERLAAIKHYDSLVGTANRMVALDVTPRDGERAVGNVAVDRAKIGDLLND